MGTFSISLPRLNGLLEFKEKINHIGNEVKKDSDNTVMLIKHEGQSDGYFELKILTPKNIELEDKEVSIISDAFSAFVKQDERLFAVEKISVANESKPTPLCNISLWKFTTTTKQPQAKCSPSKKAKSATKSSASTPQPTEKLLFFQGPVDAIDFISECCSAHIAQYKEADRKWKRLRDEGLSVMAFPPDITINEKKMEVPTGELTRLHNTFICEDMDNEQLLLHYLKQKGYISNDADFLKVGSDNDDILSKNQRSLDQIMTDARKQKKHFQNNKTALPQKAINSLSKFVSAYTVLAEASGCTTQDFICLANLLNYEDIFSLYNSIINLCIQIKRQKLKLGKFDSVIAERNTLLINCVLGLYEKLNNSLRQLISQRLILFRRTAS